MGRKIFVSYKYKDRNVQALPGITPFTWCRDYVNYIEEKILDRTNNIYKGEHQDEDLSDKSEAYIWDHLKNKIYDSSITIVLISPNMKEPSKRERSQWIPWEISYSLRETTRNDRTSHNNAILAIVLPDKNGSYNYYDNNKLFTILKENISNGYIHVEEWDFFKKYPGFCINAAIKSKEDTPTYKIVKSI